MIDNSSIWVVSDVDGTLMDHSYDLSPAKETIKKLQKLSIPVILCTSKTASEVRVIRKELNLTDPYIVENGAAIYGESLEKVNGEIILGIQYEFLEEIINSISNEIDYKLIPLNNLNDQEATQLTGLKGNSLKLMRDRHWSLPFLNPPSTLEEKINICCKKFKVDVFKGNRMSHLLSTKSNKGKAINALKEYSNIQNIEIIGLGDSPNDLPLLLNSDIKIVIPGIDGPNLNLLDQLKDFEFTLASEPNGYGWKNEINRLINKRELS
ncbi:mannosyl-3-phosphoglycerate phosphatase-related protein YedP [Prochlorococcus marinus]|uniref:mannosyl-3-phosphoglycerate phosphatase-related protein YedP n=1 Tax=Prochlorococcus marinus TaxID=1219 RepID=UPI001ADBFAA1|nr:mannosyl-3-phosphoglycerate phosphatase-related protein YedP [Prochlorococcus marinus]MBO8217166.1 mannosyl-3-phosphoglycerate phosphatase-related protein [Prochlorococcus marinus XMU1405]MBW3040390.1 mannosyl-3-phosphoglycerate phosphatase-related protein [Prochlorococcus marinus str. MU1405]MBW3047848.1 mannosyl-3-phosphoglycerate phosphatase-related protein [Prochlorococcus marinus str. MU1406]